MINPQQSLNGLLWATLQIVCDSPTGGRRTGTGFFLRVHVPNRRALNVLVTNSHVVEGAVIGEFVFHEAAPPDGNTVCATGRSWGATVHDFESRWVHHPNGLDLCALLFDTVQEEIRARDGKHVFNAAFGAETMCSDSELAQMQTLENVVMVGYPIGLWDAKNNFPVLRRGTTATHPAIDFNGDPLGLVDIAMFPGSSGSPVLRVEQHVVIQNGAAQLMTMPLKLLGVMCAGPHWEPDGQVSMKPIPTAAVPPHEMPHMIHVGMYVKSRELAVLARFALDQWGVPAPNSPETIIGPGGVAVSE